MGSGAEWSDMVGKTKQEGLHLLNTIKKTKTVKGFLFHPTTSSMLGANPGHSHKNDYIKYIFKT